MPEFHNQIIEVGKKLGYYSAEVGTCNGYTLAWIEACLLGKKHEAQFKKLKQMIVNASQQRVTFRNPQK